ncbi:hypothetical protein EV383_0184 [Pseudonocardia sediminis]|uniref:Uncharacterized protein n=1 Tax=Pseudonocardia sediminis TaxID=1397368 RepID=A0A4Q7UNU4_PSEST|nr:hypothetical protein [Pseudonocardia sediminis]RZT83382.1 hypothetical protein EV383_0184 [Pseudonocardia sediminis]
MSPAAPSLRTWRQLTVWLHVLTSVGWMALAAVMAVSLAFAATHPALRLGALETAHHLDQSLLAPLAAGSALTGIVLSAATAFGFFHHWWVTIKFAITLVQLYLGIFVLSNALDVARTTPEQVPSATGLVLGPALMAGAIAFQGWLSIAKPWGRTPGIRRAKPPTGPRWVFAAAVVAVPVDLTVGLVLGHPRPLAAILVLVVVLVHRAWVLRGSRIAPGARGQLRSSIS